MKINSIRFKSIILYSSFLFIILIIFSGGIYLSVRHILYKNLDEDLQIKALEIASIVNSYQQFPFDPNIMNNLWQQKVKSLNLKKDFINILSPKGQPIIRSANVNKTIQTLFQKNMPFSFQTGFYKTIRNNKNQLRVINLPIHNNFFSAYIIQIGTPLNPVLHTLHRLLFYILLNIFIIMLLTSFLGQFFTQNILKPVMNVIQMANTISHKNLNRRVPETQADEEIKYLIQSFNSMIERLEKSFHHINEFSRHVAHELRTPLAIIRGEIDLILNKKHSPKEYKRVMKSTLEETERLNRLINDILLLSKLEYDQDIYQFNNLNLTEFIKDIADASKILAQNKKINLTFKAPPENIMLQGDKIHLRRLFFNLIHNAIKYTPPSGQILISLDSNKNRAKIDITDNGIGITKRDFPKIFDKFFRSSRQGESNELGLGLGLNMAQSIAQAHKGKVEVISRENHGSTFSVILPFLHEDLKEHNYK